MPFIRSVDNLLKKTRNNIILEIKICRVPLSKITLFFLNLTSLGEFKKRLNETPYDKLYHLFMIIKTDKGTFILEKNEVIIFKKFNGKFTNQTEILIVDITENLSINTLLENTRDYMGDKFYTYKGIDNNCQFFINSILKANNLNSDELETFVIQTTQKLFENNPRFRKIVNTITDVGGIATTTIDEVKTDLENTPEILRTKVENKTAEILRPILKLGFQNVLYPNI